MRPLISFLLFVSAISVVLNISIFFGVRTYRQRVSRTFEITERRFYDAVNISVTNFLCSYLVQATTNMPSSNTVQINSKPLDDSTTFYDYRSRTWKLLCDGVRYSKGDFFQQYVIWRIDEGKVYCKDGETVVIFRPRRAADASEGASARAWPKKTEEARSLD